ncbi:MAG: DNA gyrase modulator, partial [Pseudomonadota bacterium]
MTSSSLSTPSSKREASASEAFDIAALEERAAQLMEAALKAGADAADAVVGASHATSIDVRHGKVEESESSQNTAFSLRVFKGHRSASVSANAITNAATLAERAVAMASVSPEDPHAALAPREELAPSVPQLDLHDATRFAPEDLKAR